MIILVNVFAILSAVLSFFKIVTPVAFLLGSGLWFILMISFWFVLPEIIYRKSATFKDRLRVSFEPHHFFLENERGSRTWPWKDFYKMVESPHFFHLYFDDKAFFLIPKNAFDDTELSEARRILRDKIG
jgi:hypothetical protein